MLFLHRCLNMRICICGCAATDGCSLGRAWGSVWDRWRHVVPETGREEPSWGPEASRTPTSQTSGSSCVIWHGWSAICPDFSDVLSSEGIFLHPNRFRARICLEKPKFRFILNNGDVGTSSVPSPLFGFHYTEILDHVDHNYPLSSLAIDVSGYSP